MYGKKLTFFNLLLNYFSTKAIVEREGGDLRRIICISVTFIIPQFFNDIFAYFKLRESKFIDGNKPEMEQISNLSTIRLENERGANFYQSYLHDIFKLHTEFSLII